MNDFPTDETTLTLLVAACEINPDTGQSHLLDFLDMGTRERSRTIVSDGVDEDEDGMIVHVEYEPGFEPYSPQQVIVALVDEVRRLREEVGDVGKKGGKKGGGKGC